MCKILSVSFPNNMDFRMEIKRIAQKITRYWKNRKFREEVATEKKKRYLFTAEKPKERNSSFFSFFHEKKRFYYFNTIVSLLEQNKNRFRLSFLIIGSFLIALSVYIMFFSPYFKISPSRVIIERLDSITDINIAYKSIEDVYGESIFSLDTHSIVRKLTGLQKNIKHAEITRLFPNGLKIIVESYKPQFFVRFKESEKSYILTSNGILIYQKVNDSGLHFLDLVDPSFAEMSFIEYKEGIPENIMPYVIVTRDLFKSTFTATNIAKFTYFRAEREIHITLESGMIVLLRTAADIDKQIMSLKEYNDRNKDIINS